MKKIMMILGRSTLMFSVAALTMGNESCEKTPVVPTPTGERSLRKVVEMGQIRSPKMTLPGGVTFDFQFVANQQIYGVMSESSHFALKMTPIVVDPYAAISDGNYYQVSSADLKMIQALNPALTAGPSRLRLSRTAWCMANLPQFRFSGSVNSYELTNGNSISIGFTPSGGHGISNIGLDFEVEEAVLDVSLQALHPLSGSANQYQKSLIAAVNVNQKNKIQKISGGIGWGLFRFGGGIYRSTPLATVSKLAFISAVSNMATKLEKEPWYTRVLTNEDKLLVISGGRDLQIEKGDEFYIYNETLAWDGEPCQSEYRGSVYEDERPLAWGSISGVGDEISFLKIEEQFTSQIPEIGAKVVLKKLHDPEPTPK